MMLLDVNLLLYSQVSSMQEHPRARAWFDRVMAGPARVGIPWPCLIGFVRLASNPRVFSRPSTVAEAWSRAQGWLARSNVWVPAPGEEHARILGRLLEEETSANRVSDAHLAALAMEHGLTLMSTDRDFTRFRGLRWENPLSARE